MRLLLISNSTNAGEEYLAWPMQNIEKFLGKINGTVLFIPYAGITVSFENYEARVNARFAEAGLKVKSIHKFPDPLEAVQQAGAIIVGGGNTWQLIHLLQKNKLLAAIREKVLAGTPYIGWSAGSNICCPTIRTTNDMPVVQPDSFNSLGLVPFQINPHFLDANPDGHAGETREDRIKEFIEINRDVYVVGLREGTMLLIENKSVSLIGKRKARIFRYNTVSSEFGEDGNLDFLFA